MGNMDVQFPVFGSKKPSQYTVLFRKLSVNANKTKMYFFINILVFLNIMNSLLFHIFI